MTENILDIIEEELFQDNIDTDIKDNTIVWKDNFNAENEVHLHETAKHNGIVAWWQRNEVGKELVRIKLSDALIINWRPPINTMGLISDGCSFIQFYQHYLIVKYRDKHGERAFVININKLTFEELAMKGRDYDFELIENQLIAKALRSTDQFSVTFEGAGYTTTLPTKD